jgi:hypothetical protein
MNRNEQFIELIFIYIYKKEVPIIGRVVSVLDVSEKYYFFQKPTIAKGEVFLEFCDTRYGLERIKL